MRMRAVHALCTLNDDEGVLSLIESSDGLVRLAAASGAPRKGNLGDCCGPRQTPGGSADRSRVSNRTSVTRQLICYKDSALDVRRQGSLLGVGEISDCRVFVREEAILCSVPWPTAPQNCWRSVRTQRTPRPSLENSSAYDAISQRIR